MTAPVDVLAAWDRQIEWLRDLVATNLGSECHTEELAEAIEARATVAELLESLADFEGMAEASMPGTPAKLRRLRDAYARCKGGAA